MPSSPDAFAIVQTPPGRGGIAVISLVGIDAESVIASAFDPLSEAKQAPGEGLRLGRLLDGDRVIDQVIVARRSGGFEISLHGGPAVLRGALNALSRLGATVLPCDQSPTAFQPAHPKWDNPTIGRDMLQRLTSARSPLVVSAVTQQWSAGLSELASGLPTADTLRKAADRLSVLARLLDPPEVVIAGAPNTGKSKLMNVLVGRPVSIVHDTAGTTRDWVREIALLGGVPVWLTDTAGLWRTANAIDAEAVRRARESVAGADLVILLADGAVPAKPPWLDTDRVLTVSAKCDLHLPAGKPDAIISAVTGEGLGDLSDTIVEQIGLSGFDPTEPAAFTERQADLLTAAADALDSADRPGASSSLRQLLAG